jgi:hypothetical protein
VGETAFYFRAGTGIIAAGQVVGQAFRANSIFGQADEYHRTVNNLLRLRYPVTVAEIRENTGYNLPCRCIVCRLNHQAGVRYILDRFRNGPFA